MSCTDWGAWSTTVGHAAPASMETPPLELAVPTPPLLLEPLPLLLELAVPPPLELPVSPLLEPPVSLPLLLEVPPDEDLTGPASPDDATVPPQLEEAMEAYKERYATTERGRMAVRQSEPTVAAAPRVLSTSRRGWASRKP